jgi:hypothetical protein
MNSSDEFRAPHRTDGSSTSKPAGRHRRYPRYAEILLLGVVWLSFVSSANGGETGPDSPTATLTPTYGNCADGCNGQPCGPLRADGSPTAICTTLPLAGVCGCFGTCRSSGEPCGLPCPDGSFMGTCFCEFACICIQRGCPSVCAQCPCTGDSNGDGQVTIDEILGAVNNALSGCP